MHIEDLLVKNFRNKYGVLQHWQTFTTLIPIGNAHL
jgi:hypothetical protein